MSEHEPIDKDSFEKLLSGGGRQLTGEEMERVDNHLMYGGGHSDKGYDVIYGGRGTSELEAAFEDSTRAHLAAILRGEITAEDLWKESVD